MRCPDCFWGYGMRAIISVMMFGAGLLAVSAAFLPPPSMAAMAAMMSTPGGQPQKLETSKLVVETGDAQYAFTIELADSRAEHSIGMMFRTEMADDSGMLFEYLRPQRVGYWMKNTYIALDIIFVGKDARIINIAHMTEPHSLDSVRSAGPVLAVLEIKGGMAEHLGIKAGDLIRHRMFKNLEVAE